MEGNKSLEVAGGDVTRDWPWFDTHVCEGDVISGIW